MLALWRGRTWALTMAEFQRQNETANAKEEVLNEALADRIEDSDGGEEADAITS